MEIIRIKYCVMAKHDINFPIQLATVRIASFTLNFIEISTVLEKHDTKVQ